MIIVVLLCQIYKAVNNLPGGNLNEFFVRNNHNNNLRSRSELTIPSINTVFKGNVQFILLCNPQKLSVNVGLMKKLKSILNINLGEDNF